MKLDDIAKMAIDEVAMELKEISEVSVKNTRTPPQTEPKQESLPRTFSADMSGEEIFLKNLKERILVLFEGLNATSEENLKDRLSLTLKFLEFVLANVENRLENLQK